MNSEIILWINNNEPAIIDLLNPLIKQREESLLVYDQVFHDEIVNQFESLAFSIIGIEVCRSLGCSVEEYYDTIEEEIVFDYVMSIIFKGEQNDQHEFNR